MCRQQPVGKTIGEVEKLTGIPKRTLKYYIERKIIVPGCKSSSGYWLYTDADVEKLRLVYLCRELQFPVSEIRAMVAAPKIQWPAMLDRQIDRLLQRRSQAEDRLLTAELVRYRCRTGRPPESEDSPPACGRDGLFESHHLNQKTSTPAGTRRGYLFLWELVDSRAAPLPTVHWTVGPRLRAGRAVRISPSQPKNKYPCRDTAGVLVFMGAGGFEPPKH